MNVFKVNYFTYVSFRATARNLEKHADYVPFQIPRSSPE